MPKDWSTSRLKYLASFKSGDGITGESIREVDEYPVFGGNGLRGYTDNYNHEGEYILIGRQGALCRNVCMASGRFWASEHAVVVDSTPTVHKPWLAAMLAAMELGQYSMTAAQPGLSMEFVSNLPVPLPPLPTQRRIATYLDRETSEIDRLTTAKERLLILVAEKRRAVISHAVTHGTGTNSRHVDSGVEWIGEIPQDWQVVRGKQILTERDERSEDGDEELLTVSHITGVTSRSEKDVTMFEAISKEGYKICHAGDLAVNTMWAFMGALGVSPINGIVSPSYNVYIPSPDVDPHYLDMLVRLPNFCEEIRRNSKSIWSSRLRLYAESLFDIRFPLPPLDEQRRIVQKIESDLRNATILEAICR